MALLLSSLCMAGCVRDRADRGTVTDTLTPSPVITTAPAARCTVNTGSGHHCCSGPDGE